MTVAEPLDAMAVWFETDRLVDWLAADAEHPARAMAWLQERRELFAEHPYGDPWCTDPELGARRLWFETYVWLAGGTAAAVAREVRWPLLELWLRGGDGWPPARDLARMRGSAWVADLAARIARRTSSHRLLAPLLREHGLPVPVGAGFLQGWVRSVSVGDAREVAELLGSEPQLVSLVGQYLASDLVRPDPPVARALPALVAEGRLERRWLLDEVLQRLTARGPGSCATAPGRPRRPRAEAPAPTRWPSS